MIVGFENQTKDLTDYEKEILLPIIVKCLRKHVGKEKAVSNAVICSKMQEQGYDITEVRTRKIINHIRINFLIECLVASGKGYYVANTESEMRRYIISLECREGAIAAMRMALEEQLERMKKGPVENIPDGSQSSP